MKKNELGYTFNEVFQHQAKQLQLCYETLYQKKYESNDSKTKRRKN